MTKKPMLAAVLVAALATAGCGGESRAKDKQEFLARANALCGSYEDQQNQVRFPQVNPIAATASHADRAKWGLSLKQIVDLGRQEVAALRKLEPPDELKVSFDRLVGEMDASFDLLAQGAEAAKRNRPDELQAKVAKARARLAKATTIANQLGAKACA